MELTLAAVGAVAVVIGVVAGVLVHKMILDKHEEGAVSKAEKLLEEAANKAEQTRKDLMSETREEIHRLRQEADRETKERRSELQRAERKLEQKEENLDRKLESVVRKEEELKAKFEDVKSKMDELSDRESALISRLEEIARLSRDEAKEILLAEVENEASHIIGLRLKELEEKAKRESDRKKIGRAHV